MKIYSQRDIRWENDKIGASSLTIGDFGCTGTCLCSLTTAWPDVTAMTPKELFLHADWFTPDGLIIWGKLNIKGLKFDGRLYAFCDAAVSAAAKDPNRAALIEVLTQWKGKDGRAIKHWVVAVSKSVFGGWRIMDPLSGTYKTMPPTYKPVGCAFFTHTK